MTASVTGGAHIPVMLTEVLAALSPKDGGVYVDGTFGGGGYTSGILGVAGCTVWAIDRDPDAIVRGQAMATEFHDRLGLIEGLVRFASEIVSVGERDANGRVHRVQLDGAIPLPGRFSESPEPCEQEPAANSRLRGISVEGDR